MKLGYVIVYVQDVPASLAFYERAFGLARKFLHESNQYGELDTGGTTLSFANEGLIAAAGILARPNRRTAEPAGAEVGLLTDDVAAAFERAVAAGAALLDVAAGPRGELAGVLLAGADDPRDLLVGLVEHLAQQEGGALLG